jgi:glycosyltransferase involved in cell wall biosynthesis
MPMKILVFAPYYPPHIGGVEFYAEEMHTYLAQNHKLTVFTPQLPIDSPAQEISNNIQILRFPAIEIIPNYSFPKIWSLKFWKLFFSLFQQKFNIILSHTRFFNTSLLALIYAKIKRTKWLHIEHGSDFVKSGGKITLFLAKLYDYTIGKLILTCSNENIAISENVATFIKKFNKRHSSIIRRGIDEKKINNIPKNKNLALKYADTTTIGFVGRLVEGKGIRDLITALTNLKSQNFVCLIIGSGPQNVELQKLVVKHNLQEKIFFLGEKTREETIAIIKSFDIFVNPSYTEGLPTTVLEAAACGKAIIATDVGGTNEIIKHNETGYLFMPKDISALQQYLIDLIENPDKMKEFGKKTYIHVLEEFSWKKSIKKYENEFEKIINEK